MGWIGKPYRKLPPPVVLKRDNELSYMSGVKKDGWIRWKSQQKVGEGKFILKDWLELPFGFEGTRNLIMKINADLLRGRRTNLRQWASKHDVDLREANYDVFGRFMPYQDMPAAKIFPAGTVCLLWQVGLGGSWCIVSRYGVMEGVDVSIREDVEWQLRHGLMLGFMYFFGKSTKFGKGRSIQKLLKGRTTWDWDDVDIYFFAQAEEMPAENGRYIELGDEKWKMLGNYAGKLRVGNKIAILDNTHIGGEVAWQRFCEDAINGGSNLAYQTENGFRYYNGWGWEYVTQERYDALFRKVRDID